MIEYDPAAFEQRRDYFRRTYKLVGEKYKKAPVIPRELVPRNWLSLAQYALLHKISRQRAHQLFRCGLIRGAKIINPPRKRVYLTLDPDCPPPKLHSWSRKKYLRQLGLE